MILAFDLWNRYGFDLTKDELETSVLMNLDFTIRLHIQILRGPHPERNLAGRFVHTA